MFFCFFWSVIHHQSRRFFAKSSGLLCHYLDHSLKFPINWGFLADVLSRRQRTLSKHPRWRSFPPSSKIPWEGHLEREVTRGSAPHLEDVILPMSFAEVSNLILRRTRGFPAITTGYLECSSRGVQNWSYLRERLRGHAGKRARGKVGYGDYCD